MSRKLISIISASLLAITLSGCGYQGHFRYACQDPANWGATQCEPPICGATGVCTKDLLGYDPEASVSDIIETVDVVETDTAILENEE